MTHNRIIITFPVSALDSPGGGARSCLQIAQQLVQQGVEVILVPVTDKPADSFGQQPFEIVPAVPNPIHYLFNGLSVLKAVKSILSQKHVDAVLSWEHEGAFLPKLLKQHNVVFGMIAASPSYEVLANRNKSLRWLANIANERLRWQPFKQADVVFVSSEFTRQELVSLFDINPDKIKITYRGIATDFHHVPRQPIEKISNLIFYGSLSPIKGVFDVITSLGLVAQQGHRDWTLKIAGWGNEKEVLAAARKYDIESNITLLGKLTPTELIKELEWAHLAILPSRAESFGRAIAEAQAAALPLVSYSTGSIPEIVENGVTGWLVPPLQTDQLASAIIDAMKEPQRTFNVGLAGRNNVVPRFTWENVANAITAGIEYAVHAQ